MQFSLWQVSYDGAGEKEKMEQSIWKEDGKKNESEKVRKMHSWG